MSYISCIFFKKVCYGQVLIKQTPDLSAAKVLKNVFGRAEAVSMKNRPLAECRRSRWGSTQFVNIIYDKTVHRNQSSLNSELWPNIPANQVNIGTNFNK